MIGSMYTNEFVKTLQQLQQYIQYQDQKLKQLAETINTLQSEVEQFKNKPSTNIERIEYKFDQLKIERLDGTLNIGLNPTDPNQIDQFEVEQNGLQVNNDMTYPPQEQQQVRHQLFQQCKEEIQHFLNNDCVDFIKQAEQQLQLRLDEPHRRHIIEDIRKQIDSRIQYYMNEPSLSNLGDFNEQKHKILQQVKADVENSIKHFLNHLPKGPE